MTGISISSTNSISWARSAIRERYAQIEEDGGVDFNHDGQIAGTERLTDSNGNGTVGDNEDYLTFLEHNRRYIQNEIEFVKATGEMAAGNIINQILFAESGSFTPAQVNEAYELINGIINEVSRRDSEDMTPDQRLQLFFQVMEEQGFELENQSDSRFIANILNHELDCDTSSLIVMAVAEDLGWPVQMMSLPNHAFVRWDDGNVAVNIDSGEVNTYTDIDYANSPHHAFPVALSRDGIISHAYTNIGQRAAREGHYETGLAAAQRALEIDPNNTRAMKLHGICKRQLSAPRPSRSSIPVV